MTVKLINLTARDVTLETDMGLLALPRGPRRANVTVHYQRPATGGTVECRAPADTLVHAVQVRRPQWGSHRTKDEDGRETAIEHLPAPAPGVAYLVTGMVAEQAVLDGRTLDDLYVVLEISKNASDTTRTMASVIPAVKATPAMDTLVAARQHLAERDRMRTVVMQLARALGQSLPHPEGPGFLVRTNSGAAWIRQDANGSVRLLEAEGDVAQVCARFLIETNPHHLQQMVDAALKAPSTGPVRPGEVRRAILADNPSPAMCVMADLCRRRHVPTLGASQVEGIRDGDLFVGCRPAVGQHRVIDSHTPGDAGFGMPPAAYLLASSIGQVAQVLGGLHLLTQYERVTAACDHCLGPALQGRCPGVTSVEVEQWLADHEPGLHGWGPVPQHELEAELVAVYRAPVLALSQTVEAVDLRGLALTYAARMIGTFRRDMRVFVHEVEVQHPPVGWPKGQACKRVMLGGMVAADHFSAFRMWAELQGGVGFFPACDPKTGAAGGFAGFYV